MLKLALRGCDFYKTDMDRESEMLQEMCTLHPIWLHGTHSPCPEDHPEDHGKVEEALDRRGTEEHEEVFPSSQGRRLQSDPVSDGQVHPPDS